jgi:hypothetical protein
MKDSRVRKRAALSERQKELLVYLLSAKNPSIREIQERFEYSYAYGWCILRVLRKKGYVSWKDGKCRTIKILKDADGDPIPPAPAGYETAAFDEEKWAFQNIPAGCTIERVPKKGKKPKGFFAGDYLILNGPAGKKELGFDGAIGYGRGKRIAAMFRRLHEESDEMQAKT